ncbi:probable protein-lysine methyltransferase METTL21D [Coccomyxa sp. Obi]|nr:probable protein-lysine methyltransferase METTL21D [Coccomyxa sp. Obi]
MSLCRSRFQRPYIHRIRLPGADHEVTLTIKQARFTAEGFASTVWDSSIVMAKYFERCAERYRGLRCLDLSAGCGLVGIVLGTLGADVTATDLPGNLPLLADNFNTNGVAARVVEHWWGSEAAPLLPPFDVIIACDVMYIHDAIGNLITTLKAVSTKDTEVFIAHGRNRQAEATFLAACVGSFAVTDVASDELDPLYQCSDVRVMRLRKC